MRERSEFSMGREHCAHGQRQDFSTQLKPSNPREELHIDVRMSNGIRINLRNDDRIPSQIATGELADVDNRALRGPVLERRGNESRAVLPALTGTVFVQQSSLIIVLGPQVMPVNTAIPRQCNTSAALHPESTGGLSEFDQLTGSTHDRDRPFKIPSSTHSATVSSSPP